MTFPFGKTITVTRQTVNPDGDRTPGASFPVEGCAFYPNTSQELVNGQETVTWDRTVLCPPGTDVRPTDTVTVDGVVYEVYGQPMAWQSPITGFSSGVEVLLRTQTG